MTLLQRMSRSKTARCCISCDSKQVTYLGTQILKLPNVKHVQNVEIEHRFRCRQCYSSWSEFV